ncbi:efflux RND transporter periplasmic adaptor subunit [Bacteroidota bacterium]
MKYSLVWLFITVPFMMIFNNCNTSHKDADTEAHLHEDLNYSFTSYSSHFELFAEISPLIKDDSSEVVAHFTFLNDYKPVMSGRLTAILKIGELITKKVLNEPTRPGIFIFNIKPKKAGHAQLDLIINTAEHTDTFTLHIDVNLSHDDLHAHEKDHSAHESEGIVFLKEQAWETDFAIYKAIFKNYAETIPAFGELLETSGSEYQVIAKHSGIVYFEIDHLVPGIELNPHDNIMIISSANLLHDNFEVTFDKTKMDLEKARQEYERAYSLYQDQIISQKVYLTAKNEYEKIQKDFELLKDHFKPGGHHIHIKKKGYLKQIHVDEGQYVDIGQLLLSISNKQRMMLKAEIPLKYKSGLNKDISANFKSSDGKEVYRLADLNGRLISISQSMSKGSSLIPVFFEFDNPGNLYPGTFAEVFISKPSKKEKLIVPSNALIENQEMFYLIIQLEGELYEKREVKVGGNDGYMAEIISGLNAGEYVVTKGAYRVYLSSMSSELPEHAHVH